MKILALDSSSRFGSLALTDGLDLVAEYTVAGVVTQNERLFTTIQRILADVGWELGDLEGAAVVHGPGSFTGIRVGLAAIQGLAFAAGIPAVGLSSLRALALALPPSRVPVCTVMDAKKDEIYCALFQRTKEGLEVLLPEQAAEPEVFVARLMGEVCFVGDGCSVVRPFVKRSDLEPYFLSGSSGLCRASVVATWAAVCLSQDPPPGLGRLRPHYLRVSAAELRLRRMQLAPFGR